jgi:hypothetical protein
LLPPPPLSFFMLVKNPAAETAGCKIYQYFKNNFTLN